MDIIDELTEEQIWDRLLPVEQSKLWLIMSEPSTFETHREYLTDLAIRYLNYGRET